MEATQAIDEALEEECYKEQGELSSQPVCAPPIGCVGCARKVVGPFRSTAVLFDTMTQIASVPGTDLLRVLELAFAGACRVKVGPRGVQLIG